jgi:malonyl-CoA/methylmalonyl-CoA synthetase
LRALTGQSLLERYGMSEVGMALSQPLHGARHPGTVGRPLPGMSARVVPTGEDPEAEPGAVTGELELRGETLFAGYWRQAPATEAAFRDKGWFRTGDVVARSPQGVYRILGRRSVDILKTGGYKVSALEIEEVLRTHPAVAEAAVVGLPDPAYGQVLAAAIVARSPVGAESLRAWTAERLASYKVPRRWRLLDELPRNALGKVLKPRLAEEFGAD